MSRGPQVVVVTGASAGVRRATVRKFARHGARIGLLARGMEGLTAAQREVEKLGSESLVIPTDVAKAEQARDPGILRFEWSPQLWTSEHPRWIAAAVAVIGISAFLAFLKNR